MTSLYNMYLRTKSYCHKSRFFSMFFSNVACNAWIIL